jgi:polyisoprenyl-teichoic acid--peptidoglycan teichoic acid transferase
MRRQSPFDSPPDAAVRRPSTHRSWVQRVLLTTGVAASTLCLAVSGFVGYSVTRIGSNRFEEADASNIVEVGNDEPQNWLVVGSDNRDDVAGNRTDTIMVVRVDPQSTKVDILSFQRDLWVPIAGASGMAKINSAYGANDKPNRLIDTLKLNFNIDVNHYVEIDFRTFEEVVKAVDGVPMYFDRPVQDRAAGLFVHSAIAGEPPGCRTLDPEQALAFSRSRHLEMQDKTGKWKEEARDDYGRISRQQYFMRRVFERAAAKAKNPLVMRGMVSAVNAHIKLDANVDLDDAETMLRRFASFNADTIQNWSLPTEEATRERQAVLLPKTKESVPILNIFRGLDPHDADPQQAKFTVLNGSGKTGQAAKVQEAYRAVGYQAENGGDAPARLSRTEVRAGWGGQELAAQVERHLTSGATFVPDATMEAGKVVLITGEDLTTVMRRPRPWAPLVPGPSAPGTETPAPATGGTTTTGPPPAVPPPGDNATFNAGDTVVGYVPGQAPPGVECN